MSKIQPLSWTATGALCASLLLMACGGGSNATGSTTGNDTTAVAKSDTVFIAKMQFKPATLTVHAGDEVVFMNNDVVAHDATALPDSAWTSGKLDPGQSWKLVADKSTDYFCSIHQVMKGHLEVQP
ncbi:MAG TPA: plastocyanin/azurin family copper-binding protein [Flavobacteriales bacterium]|nr:plastocyanin/azurin family copper-binding protein [Flavobacteriales bacterium]HRO40028.1 plastocyanin/azurin family copper-binding protein [Flavobacteriales bacterium]HRP81646.1 plastocyanin/azurin family copper-binding protein [Flavobacteriales bacterium]HRQ85162.1 plastocyanin/azurin family copper-binding protein [Flavobacteriales bacterium]